MDYLLFEDPKDIQTLNADSFNTFLVKTELDDAPEIKIYKDLKNNILCSLLLDSFELRFQAEKRILDFYLPHPHTPFDDFQKKLVLQMKSDDFDLVKEIYDTSLECKRINRYRSPLAVQPSHEERDTLLTKNIDLINFGGFGNLLFIIIVVSNFRLFMESLLQSGFALSWSLIELVWSDAWRWPSLTAATLAVLIIMIVFQVQRLRFLERMSENTCSWIMILIHTIILVWPPVLTYLTQPAPFPSIMILFLHAILFLKLISYAHVMKNIRALMTRIKKLGNLRRIIEHINQNEISQTNLELLKRNLDQPLNLCNLRDLWYFIAAPTLCFQFSYPRNKRIRKTYVLKKSIEFVVEFALMHFFIFQFHIPTMNHTLSHYQSRSFLHMIEKLILLSLPTLYIWLLIFFMFFESWMNILAELLRFADRNFYMDWWNCPNLQEFWRMWNLPTHHWLVRHLYNPLLKRGYSKATATWVVFLVSALAHEYVLSFGLNTPTYWAFAGMLLQAPIILVQRKLEGLVGKNTLTGNISFWVTFCFIGEPALAFIYFYLYMTKP